MAANFHFADAPDVGQLAVGETVAFGFSHEFVRASSKSGNGSQATFQSNNHGHVVEEPAVDACEFVDLINRHSVQHGQADGPDAIGVGHGQRRDNIVACWLQRGAPGVLLVHTQSEPA